MVLNSSPSKRAMGGPPKSAASSWSSAELRRLWEEPTEAIPQNQREAAGILFLLRRGGCQRGDRHDLLHPFRDNGCVQQKTHRSSSRGESWTHSTCKWESRRGDAAKNSAKFPTRRVLRSHSSAEAITAVSWPLRVMVC